MRSMVGVGITPPNVLGAPKPWSSVMMSSTFGAPFGGTTRGGHHGVDSEALSLITPPNLGSGGGSCFPVIVVVASGERSARYLLGQCGFCRQNSQSQDRSADDPSICAHDDLERGCRAQSSWQGVLPER